MGYWKFFEYITAVGQNPTRDWYNAQTDVVKLQFDVTLALLRATRNWEDRGLKNFKILTARHLGLAEVRFSVPHAASSLKRKVDQRFRAVGIWPPHSPGEFILLLGSSKVRGTYIPHMAFDVAMSHKLDFEQGKGSINERF